ncbi:unnamed protein product [Fusarium graminearum]|uniref:Uncharacterized protein n=1 Tax=Gibberella zeae TaxID=5518 RepID=A0A4E9D0T9_GIBZA|nr:hypothetical protein HG531_006698 [Fusarium graminearum]CAG1969751.1 unnamed protein product [Fusarium graminearum]CAG1976252.1 unnamed protein product [Fusarium graminearum]CAG2001885.1 unnamed protein product [Fusarium graminearum]
MIVPQNPNPQANGTSEFPSPVQIWLKQRIREFNEKMGLEKSEINKYYQQMTLLQEQYDKAVAEHQSTAEKTREQIKNLEDQLSQAQQHVERHTKAARRLGRELKEQINVTREGQKQREQQLDISEKKIQDLNNQLSRSLTEKLNLQGQLDYALQTSQDLRKQLAEAQQKQEKTEQDEEKLKESHQHTPNLGKRPADSQQAPGQQMELYESHQSYIEEDPNKQSTQAGRGRDEQSQDEGIGEPKRDNRRELWREPRESWSAYGPQGMDIWIKVRYV